MLFREVLSAVRDVLERTPWLSSPLGVTCVRDLEGRVRLLFDPAPPGVSDHDRDALSANLGASIGAWLGNETPVWQPGTPYSGLLDVVKAGRRPWFTTPSGGQVWLLERHASRHGWVGDLAWQPPWDLEAVDRGDRPPILVFFSHKGGVGRTTALVAAAMHLSALGLKALAVDLDLEAPGLGVLTGATPSESLGAPDEAPSPGLVDLLLRPDTTAADDLEAAVKLVSVPHLAPGIAWSVLPVGAIDDDYVQVLARLDMQGARDAQRMSEVLARLLDALNTSEQPDVILLDARAGFHDVGGVALAALCHGAVFFGTSSEQSWPGLRQVGRILGRRGAQERTELLVVHAMAQPGGNTDEDERFRSMTSDILSEVYYEDPHPEEALGEPHDVVQVPWTLELRGKGGPITPRVAAILLGPPWEAVTRRICGWFEPLREKADR